MHVKTTRGGIHITLPRLAFSFRPDGLKILSLALTHPPCRFLSFWFPIALFSEPDSYGQLILMLFAATARFRLRVLCIAFVFPLTVEAEAEA
jgi:hypothetical protein